MTRRREPKPRITDADTSAPKLLDAESIAADVERFLSAGGAIERPAFRRDFLKKFSSGQQGLRRTWATVPPDLRFHIKGKPRD